MTVQILEITGRAIQGVTRPFICRGDNNEIYFVKGIGASRRSQICEWIAGQLAVRLGLPVAPFEIVDIPAELLPITSDAADLGEGPAFGSQKQIVVELSVSQRENVPQSVQRDVLAFDWWIRNADRTLTGHGGNPNLFWSTVTGKLVVIDHNQAFDPDFVVNDFLQLHVFASQRDALFGDWVLCQQYNAHFEAAMADWDVICHTIPDEWWFIDPQQTIPTQFDLDEVYSILMRFHDVTFWKPI
jgi:hypothetical protein